MRIKNQLLENAVSMMCYKIAGVIDACDTFLSSLSSFLMSENFR